MAFAQTPDGETPANEGVCDELQGYTPGLYGLCVAFCESQDFADVLTPITEADLKALGAGAPSGKILENYNKRKKETDPAMPCIKVEEPCPCWDSLEFDQTTLYSGLPFNSCYFYNGEAGHIGSQVTLADLDTGEIAHVGALHRWVEPKPRTQCVWQLKLNGQGINERRWLDINQDQAMACDAQIRPRIEEMDLTSKCVVID